MALTEEQLRTFVPRNYFLKEPYNVIVPEEEEEEEEEATSSGITNTDAFTNSGDGGGGGPFEPYTAQSPESYITNRSSIGKTGYLQGTEPEENYMNKIGGMIKSGIGMAIPGGNFLMGLAQNQSRENRLNAFDNAFIDMQLANQETPFHGHGNLTNQDYYGYNKESMFGNYAALVSKHAKKAEKKKKNKEKLTDFDEYYMEKEKELEDSKKEVEFNNWMNQRITAKKLREQEALGIKTSYKPDIHGGDEPPTTTDQNQTGDGGGIDLNPSTDRDRGRSRKEGETGQIAGGHHFRSGGRVYLNLGGLASMLGREGLAPGGPAGGASAGGDYGGNVNPEQEYAGSTFEERHGGGDNQNNTVVVPKTNYIDVKPELLRENPYVDFSVMSPLEKLKLQATIGYRDIFDNDDLYAKGDLTTKLGPVTTKTQFTDDGIGNTDINWNNFSTTIDPNKNVQNIGYNNSYNGINYGVNYADGNTMFNVGTTFKHGGLARLL